MLDPEYLQRVSEGGEEIAEQLHNDIIKRIVERIAIRIARGDEYILTPLDKWQIKVLQDSGLLLEDILKEISAATKLMQEEIASAMEDAGIKALEYDHEIYRKAGLSPEPLEKSPHLVRLMQRTFEKTLGEWKNFTGTTAEACQQAFVGACDKAYSQVASGALGYSQAYMEAINAIVKDGGGIEVQYPTGHRDTIETATLRCIRTGVSQATAEITDARMEEMDWDTILVSSHLGARVTGKEDYTNHYWWQGKFYSKSGKDPRFPPYSACGDGHVQGIHGANCRHSHGPGDGEFNPYDQYDSEENQKEYDLQQKQRAMERRIRKSKHQVMGYGEAAKRAETPEAKAEAEEAYQNAAALLKQRNLAYTEFCEKNNLKPLNERIAVAQWDRKQAAKAREAAKKAEKSVANENTRGIMSERGLAMSLRKPKTHILTEAEIESIIGDAKTIDADVSVFRFNSGSRTGFVEERGLINIRGDILPDTEGVTARDRMSQRAVIAHEYYGHYKNHPSPYGIDDWRDEFRASYDAAIRTPNLTDEERRDLMIDAYDRAKEAGAFEGFDDSARRIIYGYY